MSITLPRKLIFPIVSVSFITLMFGQATAPRAFTPSEVGRGAQNVPEDHRPPLFFREDFKVESIKPITNAQLTNPQLELGLYGPGKDLVELSHHESPKDDPAYVWLGACTQACAIGLRDKGNFVDLSGLAKVKWRTKQSGFHELRLTLKLADGTWLISEHFEGPTADWHETEFTVSDTNWRRVDFKFMNEGALVEKPDLSKVDEIGWTDLRGGSGSGTGGANGSSRIDWIEVYGRPVKR